MIRLDHRRTRLAAAATLVASLATILFFQPAHADEAGAISLTIPPSVRGEAMGGIYLSTANDYSARWGNPANLAFIRRGIVGGMYSKLVPDLADDVFFTYFGWVAPFQNVGTMAFDLTYLSYGESEATDETGVSQGTFSSYEVAPAVGLGFQFLPNVGLGIAAKWVRVDLAPENVLRDPTGSGSGVGTSWAFDLGAVYQQDRLRVGAVIANLGPDITFIDAEQSDPMPRTFRFGGMYDVYNTEIGSARFGAEWERSLVSFERSSVFHLGAEFVYAASFAIRAGYTNDKDGDIKGATGGFGFTWANAALDYANVPQASDLDRVHRFALWYRY